MFISNVQLNNFRIYKGLNSLDFNRIEGKNVSIISGNNGFGKTSFLTSLVWCFYGKYMQDVEKKFKEEIYEAGGYKKYALLNLNNIARLEGETNYSVSVSISDIFIPAIPCKEITIIRSFNTTKELDNIEILIDGNENELTKEVGNDIFINDFILPKEIAKFFFFDAEKIVGLAEMRSLQDRKNLSSAYSEVLGIKKYEDLRKNLEDLRIRFRRNSATLNDRQKLDSLRKDINTAREIINLHEKTISSLQDEKLIKKSFSEQLQERLIREGHSISARELSDLKLEKEKLSENYEILKGELKELLDIAPFAIAGKNLAAVKAQLDYEIKLNKRKLDPEVAELISKNINTEILQLILPENTIYDIYKIVKKHLTNGVKNEEDGEKQVLLSFAEKEINEFEAVFNNLKYAFNNQFKQINKEIRSNRVSINKIIRQINDGETKENDLLIREIRKEKIVVEKRIEDIDNEIIRLSIEIESYRKELIVKSKQEAELAKIVKLDEADKVKDETAGRLIVELDAFVKILRNNKKFSLEKRIKNELNKLMHKTNFVESVLVTVDYELIDIILYDNRGEVISKESLSKGEQQLYATALLKALVDESNIKFPIFIDSPLQKFDPQHTKNIISEFYPFISDQVVLFPLLKKELTESEYQLLIPKLCNTYFIANVAYGYSKFIKVEPTDVFRQYELIHEVLQ